MHGQIENSAGEMKGLHRCINDLISVVALPAVWRGSEPSQIVHTLLDALLHMLALDFIYARLKAPAATEPIEVLRVAHAGKLKLQPQEIREVLSRFGDDSRGPFLPARIRFGADDVSILPLQMGLRGDFGVVIAGSERANFPLQTETLLLSVAANEALIALQEARLLNEQKHIASELELRVAQRTAELIAANEELKKEIGERRRVEQKLRQSRTELRRITDAIPTLIHILRPDGTVLYANQAVLDYTGLTLEDVQKDEYRARVLHPDDLARLRDELREALTRGVPFENEQRAISKEGTYRWFLVHYNPLLDERGQVLQWYAAGTDITERKQGEEALRASELRLRHVIDTIPTLAWCNLPDGTNEFLNKGWHDYTGLSPEESHGWGWQVAVHPEDLPPLMETWRNMLDSGEPGEIEARLRRSDGTYRWFLIRAEPLRDEAGKIVRWYGTSTDIDDRKRAEEQLRRSEAFLAEAQRLSSTGSFSWRPSTNGMTWSDEVYRIFGFDRSITLTPELIDTRIHPDNLALWAKTISRSRTGSSFEIDYRLLMPDRSVKHLHAIAHATRDKDGQLEYIGAVQDVTERRFSEDALGKLRSELARVARITSLGVLTASIAHEVNQPLSGIVTNASTCLRMLAANPPNVEGARETARRTIRDGNRASDVITRLHALFRKKDIATELVDLNEAAREVIALTLSELQRNRVVLRPEFADELPPITGDRVQLQQVILNLLRNASDAMSAVDDRLREVAIRTERDEDDHVRLTVRDAGIGFDPLTADRLFEAFYTTKNDGMGIGLSVSRSIIEAHRGRLWATSNDGPGATFSFCIPCRQEEGLANDDLSPSTRMSSAKSAA